MYFRNDRTEPQTDGSRIRYTDWMGGPTIAGVENCRVLGIERRYTVRTTGHSDTYFSIPAVTTIKRRTVRGYLTPDDGVLYFRPYLGANATIDDVYRYAADGSYRKYYRVLIDGEPMPVAGACAACGTFTEYDAAARAYFAHVGL